MSLNTTLCHPEMESLADAAFADAYLAAHPRTTVWSEMPGTTEEATALKERYLAAASRMIGRAPLAGCPLAAALGLDAPQGLGLPIEGHPVIFGACETTGDKGFTDPQLAGTARERIVGGSVRLESGEILAISEFDSETGMVTFAEAPESDFGPGDPYTLIEALPIALLRAACEQAIYLAGGPNLAALDEMGRGLTQAAATGMGGGSVRFGRVSPLGELCFAARRLLAIAGVLPAAGGLPCGRA